MIIKRLHQISAPSIRHAQKKPIRLKPQASYARSPRIPNPQNPFPNSPPKLTDPQPITTPPQIIRTSPQVIPTNSRVIRTNSRVVCTHPQLVPTNPQILSTHQQMKITHQQVISTNFSLSIINFQLTLSLYAARNLFGLCPLMCGKAVPFRLSPLKVEAPPHFSLRNARRSLNFLGGTRPERHSLSAHQAAQPQNQSTCIR